MNKLTYLLLCLVLGIGLATAQTRKVTGTVISAEDSEPIIGASVIVKGTTTGTVTDFDGVFSLELLSQPFREDSGIFIRRNGCERSSNPRCNESCFEYGGDRAG